MVEEEGLNEPRLNGPAFVGVGYSPPNTAGSNAAGVGACIGQRVTTPATWAATRPAWVVKSPPRKKDHRLVGSAKYMFPISPRSGYSSTGFSSFDGKRGLGSTGFASLGRPPNEYLDFVARKRQAPPPSRSASTPALIQDMFSPGTPPPRSSSRAGFPDGLLTPSAAVPPTRGLRSRSGLHSRGRSAMAGVATEYVPPMPNSGFPNFWLRPGVS